MNVLVIIVQRQQLVISGFVRPANYSDEAYLSEFPACAWNLFPIGEGSQPIILIYVDIYMHLI